LGQLSTELVTTSSYTGLRALFLSEQEITVSVSAQANFDLPSGEQGYLRADALGGEKENVIRKRNGS
jgi:hypothetical protein